MRASGGAVLLVSHELDEVLALADRVLVLMGGTIVGDLDSGRGRPRLDRRADDDRAGPSVTAAVVTVRGAPRQRGAMIGALLPLAAAIVVGSLVVAWAGASPVEFFRLLAREAFSGDRPPRRHRRLGDAAHHHRHRHPHRLQGRSVQHRRRGIVHRRDVHGGDRRRQHRPPRTGPDRPRHGRGERRRRRGRMGAGVAQGAARSRRGRRHADGQLRRGGRRQLAAQRLLPRPGHRQRLVGDGRRADADSPASSTARSSPSPSSSPSCSSPPRSGGCRAPRSATSCAWSAPTRASPAPRASTSPAS